MLWNWIESQLTELSEAGVWFFWFLASWFGIESVF